MSGLNIKYSYRDLGAAPIMLQLVEHFSDLTPLMFQLGPEGEDQTVERFTTNIDPHGNPWLPSQRAQAENGRTLLDTGRLRDSMTHDASAKEARWGTNVIYAGIHQGGGVTGRNHSVTMDAREFLGISAENDNAFTGIVVDYHKAVLGGSIQ